MGGKRRPHRPIAPEQAPTHQPIREDTAAAAAALAAQLHCMKRNRAKCLTASENTHPQQEKKMIDRRPHVRCILIATCTCLVAKESSLGRYGAYKNRVHVES